MRVIIASFFLGNVLLGNAMVVAEGGNLRYCAGTLARSWFPVILAPRNKGLANGQPSGILWAE